MLRYLLFSNKFSALNKRTLVGMLLGAYCCLEFVGICLAFAQQPYVDQVAIDNLHITKRCMSAQEGALAAGGAALEKYNLECNHQQMLKEGNNLMQVFRAHAKQKAEDVETNLKVGNLDDYIRDGTCLASDAQLPDGVKACKERQKRAKLDAQIQARESFLKHEKQRVDLVDEDGKARLLNVQKQGSNGKPDTILKDLYEQSRIQKNAAGVKQPRYWTPGVRSVEFGKSEPKIGASTLEVTEKSFSNVKSIDVGNINKGVAKDAFDGKSAETSGDTAHPVIDAALKSKQSRIEAKVRGDQVQYGKEADRLEALQQKSSASPMPKPTKVGVSEQAFESLMDGVAKSAVAENQRKGITVTGNAIDTYYVDVKTEAPSLTAPRTPSSAQSIGAPTSSSQDEEILNDLQGTF